MGSDLMASRRQVLGLMGGAAIAALPLKDALAQSLPPLLVKDSYKVGFAQPESYNPWRIAFTKSMQDEAAKLGWQIVVTDAGGSTTKQVADVDSLIAQRVDMIFLSPREEKPLVPVIKRAKTAGIPVFLLDRNVDQSLAKAGEDYVAFMGSNFVDQARRAGEFLAKITDGNAKIIAVEGTAGSSPANDRRAGFAEAIKAFPGMTIVAAQSGDFNRDKARQVMQSMLQAHPDATAVFSHADDMVLGALTALDAAGRKPGQDITVVSIDGQRDAIQAIIDGKLVATVETNPFYGPASFQIAKDYAAGKAIPPVIYVEDRFFDNSNAAEMISSAY